jgi:uncharacterized OsmC-like protein
MSTATPVKKYELVITRESDKIALASAHGTSLRISMAGMEPQLGFTAPETVIAAYGACLMTNITKEAKTNNLKLDDVRIEFNATKRNEPLGIENVTCRITLKSSEDKSKLQAILNKASQDGTATKAINEGIRASFEFIF